jgi:hypothetical protein
MKKLKLLIVAGAMILAGNLNAQKWTEGKDFKFFEGQKELLLKFTYDNMVVKGDKEADYVAKRVEEYNKKEAGKGDAWAKAWVSDRTNVFEPKFEELFNKKSDGLSADRTKTSAKYTMVINCVDMYPGYNVGISSYPANCDFELTIFETANPSKVVARGILKNVQVAGGGAAFDSGTRIRECYAKAGKILGDEVGSKAKG